MKKAILLYNPQAGSKQIINQIDYIAQRLQDMGYGLILFRSMHKGSIKEYIIKHIKEDDIDLMLISGGDGTLNECVSGLCEMQLNIPVGILPLGTANDFAYGAGIPSDLKGALDVIEKGSPQYIDIGKVNEEYFINVCNIGIFSGISHIVDQEIKNKVGKLAYYVKGIEELQHYRAVEMLLEIDGNTYEGSYIFVLVFNGKAAGGFTKLAKNANIKDGKLDVICIKKTEIHDIPRLFLKILQGEHLEDNRIDYFTGENIKLEYKNDDKQFITDIDGEKGPEFPLEIKVQKGKIQVYLL